MNTSNQNHAQPDDLLDRLVDTALAELVGGAAPPDLSARIAAATIRQRASIAQPPKTRQDRAFWVSLAVAVMLLIGVTTVLLTPFGPTRGPVENTIASATKTSGKVAELVDEFN